MVISIVVEDEFIGNSRTCVSIAQMCVIDKHHNTLARYNCVCIVLTFYKQQSSTQKNLRASENKVLLG